MSCASQKGTDDTYLPAAIQPDWQKKGYLEI